VIDTPEERARASSMSLAPVKWFNANKDYGYFKPETGSDVFIHVSVIQDDGSLEEGQASNSTSSRARKVPRPPTCDQSPPSNRIAGSYPAQAPGAAGLVVSSHVASELPGTVCRSR
jgi:cold shock CspA family protein